MAESIGWDITKLVGIKPVNIGDRALIFASNFTDKTTWFGDSVRVSDEVIGTGDGTTTVFQTANQFVIDVTHGKTTDEEDLVSSILQGEISYAIEVKIDGQTKTEREFDEENGDYLINYRNGSITFFTAPVNGSQITASYFYSPANVGSTIYIKPPTGKKLNLTQAECQFSKDLILSDDVITAVFTYNPYLGAPPAKFEYPESRMVYKTVADYVNATRGSFPMIPIIGGPTRGINKEIFQLRFEYISPIVLDDTYGAEVRVWCKHHKEMTGEKATFTFYGFIDE